MDGDEGAEEKERRMTTTDTNPTSVYSLQDVRRVFRSGSTEVAAVDGVNVEIGAGEFVAIAGPSGSGKSTTLQRRGALDRPTHGKLEFDGRDLGGMNEGEPTRSRSTDIAF